MKLNVDSPVNGEEKKKETRLEPVVLPQIKSPSLASMGVSGLASKVLQQGKEIEQVSKVSQASDTQEVFVELDRRDEVQIVQQLTGGYIEDFVYEYCKWCTWPGGVRPPSCTHESIRDLSWIGIQEATRQMSITIKPGERWIMINASGDSKVLSESKDDAPGVSIHEFPDYVRVIIRAYDGTKKIERIGVAQQKKQMYSKSKGLQDDEFYLQKALSKAERNALRQLMPQSVMKEWVDSYLKQRYGAKTKQTVADNPQPSQVNESKLKAIQDAMKAIGATDIDIDVLKSKIKTDQAADYCSAQIQNGNVEKFLTFLFGAPKTLLGEQGWRYN